MGQRLTVEANGATMTAPFHIPRQASFSTCSRQETVTVPTALNAQTSSAPSCTRLAKPESWISPSETSSVDAANSLSISPPW